jgi:hypothetical protein
VPGSTLSSMKRYNSVATCRPWTVVRAVMFSLLRTDA